MSYPKPLPKDQQDVITLLASAARLASAGTNEAAVKLPRPLNGMVFILDVTAAATDVGDTLDVKIQTKLDGTNWTDVIAFTQCLGNAGAKRHVAKLLCSTAQAIFEVATALAAGSVRHLFGDDWRVNWVLVDANANGGFTFSVTGIPM